MTDAAQGLIGTITSTLHATTETGASLGDLDFHMPVMAFVPIRREEYVRDGRVVTVESDTYGRVLISVELLRTMLTDCGFARVVE